MANRTIGVAMPVPIEREVRLVLRTTRPLLIASLLGLTVSASPQPQPPVNHPGCSLHLQITDEDGTALPKAYVLVHGEHGSNQELPPDKTGQVKASLHSGMYDLFVSASGFNPQAQIVDLRACKPVDLNLTLSIDSEHSSDGSNN
jgi:hypothetical protein